MNVDRISFLEVLASAAAAASLAAAFAFAIVQIGGGSSVTVGAAALVALMTFIGTMKLLNRVGNDARSFPVPTFDIAALGPGRADVPDELVLTDDMVLADPHDDALVLDDVLAEPASDSRVVRLFEPLAVEESIPTAGELRARIERHLDRAAHQAPPDASADLLEALAVLRRSLH